MKQQTSPEVAETIASIRSNADRAGLDVWQGKVVDAVLSVMEATDSDSVPVSDVVVATGLSEPVVRTLLAVLDRRDVLAYRDPPEVPVEPSSDVEAAELVLLRGLAFRRELPAEGLKAVARKQGLTVGDDVWDAAAASLGVETTLVNGEPCWTFPRYRPGPSLEDDFAAWLETAHGRFAVYLAERDRLARESLQLHLDVDEE